MIELIRRLSKNKIFVTEILTSSFFVNILALATPIFVIQVLQRYVAYGVTATLITLVVGIIIILIFEFFFRNLRQQIASEFEVYNATLSNQIYEKIYSIPMAFFALKDLRLEKLKTNIQLITNNLNATNLLTFIDAPFSVIFLLAVFFLHYQLGLILTFFLFMPFLFSFILKNEILKKKNDTTLEAIKQSVMFQDAVKKNITIKYFSLMSLTYNAWTSALTRLTNNKGNFENKKNYLSSILHSLAAFLTVVIIGWGAVLSVNGELSVGALIGANILAARAIAPIIKFVQTSLVFKEVDASMEELKGILSLPNEQTNGNNLQSYAGGITVDKLSLTYPNSKNPVFENISFKVNAGEIICISGNNGSGKTTLIKMILGILPYTRGNIYFDNIEILQMSVNWIRSNMSYMPQNPEFIDATLIHNILGNKKIERNILEKAIIDSDLAEFINKHPQGLQLSMQNSGNLPLGIIKRIAFTRTLLSLNQIFVFDEPTEGLDEKGKTAFKDSIKSLRQAGKTIILATSDADLLALQDSHVDLNK
tara:strand:- start:368 stop:1975 length:1608 start_codon:yes stop_codon:yes gene_type:complete